MEIGAEIGFHGAQKYGGGVVAKAKVPHEYHWVR